MNIPALYSSIILAIGESTGMDDSLLHIHAGLAVMLGTRLVTGYRLSTPIPLAMVALAELGNEVLDRLHGGSWLPDTMRDIAYTLFWPTILFLVTRFGDRLRVRERDRTGPPEEQARAPEGGASSATD